MVSFPTGSNPAALAAYHGSAIPWLEGKLLVVLGGSNSDLELRGYWSLPPTRWHARSSSLMPTRPDNTAGTDFTLKR